MTTPTISQASRPLRATTTQGDNVLIPVSLVGEEEVGRPYVYTVDFVSIFHDIDPSALLRTEMTLHLSVPGHGDRLVHGIVRRFSRTGRDRELSHYRAEIVPELWFLTLSAQSQTFDDRSPLDVVERVCGVAKVRRHKRSLSAEPRVLPYIVQYRETDFAFVSRLLEGAGLYYRFEHEETQHTLVFTDAFGSLLPAGAVPRLPILAQSMNGSTPPNGVTSLRHEFATHPESVSLFDHDFLRADDTGSTTSRDATAQVRGLWSEFLGDEGPRDCAGESRRRMEIFEATHELVRGTTNCAALQPGTRVTLTGGSFGTAGKEFHVLRVSHRSTVGDVLASTGATAHYENEFTAMPAAVPYRPPRTTPAPSVRGTHAAKVVGEGNDGDIDVDEHGRVLLHFPWDGGRGSDPVSRPKHRVHVASVWAGQQWGFVQLPRIGQEVLVEYLEGDLTRPVVTGRVYNKDNPPPYALPANKTQSGMKTRTLGGGASNFNEIRFEDKKGAEHIHVQAERDLQTRVKRNETRSVGGSQSISVGGGRSVSVGGSESGTVGKGRTWQVTGDDATSVSEMHTLHVGSWSIQTINGGKVVGVSQAYLLGVGGMYSAGIAGAMTENIGADRTITVKEKYELGAKHVVEKGAEDVEISSGAAKISLKKDGTIEISGTHITLKAGAGQVEIDPAGIISIKGPMVKINT